MNASLETALFGKHPTPRFARRGLMLDISRNRVPRLAWLRELIDALATLRYNELQLYTEHTFAYREHASVWHEASPLTAAEIRSLDAYCAARGIELVPNQNSFGHMERWLQHERYRQLAECPEGFIHPVSGEAKPPSTLHPCAESLEFMDALYAELLPNFTSAQLHVGGDEPWELGKGRSRAAAEQIGLARVYLNYMQGLFARAERHGKRAQFWADIILQHPELVAEIPPQVTPVIWGYEADSPFAEHCRAVAAAGFRNQFYVAPGAGNWNSFSGRLSVARANIQLAATHGAAHGAQGLLLTAWGDNGHHQPWVSLYPALLLAAAAAWGTELSDGALAQGIDRIFYPEQPEGNGQAILALGQIDAQLPQPAPPNSFLHSAYFASPQKLDALRELTSAQNLQLVADHLAALRRETDALDPEISLAIDFNQAALLRCLKTPLDARAQADLLNRFAELWLRRSRPGGLAASLAALKVQD